MGGNFGREFSSVQFSSVAQPCSTLYDSMDCSMPGFPVYCQLLELAQTHAHQVTDVIQPFHPRSSPFPPAFNLSQYQGLFKWVSSSHQVAKGFELQLQHQSFSEYLGLISFRIDQCDQSDQSFELKGLSRVFSDTTVQKPQFFGAQLSLWSNSHIHTWLTRKTIALTRWTFVGKVMSLLFNMLSRLVITFLPRRKRLLISWL